MKKFYALFAALSLAIVALSVMPASAGIPYCWFNKWVISDEWWHIAPCTVTAHVGEDIHWGIRITIALPGDWGGPIEDAVVTDRFGAEWELPDHDPSTPAWDPIMITQGTAGYTTKGTSNKVFFTWEVGTLAPGEMAEIRFEISTDLNPAGHQEYTSPGCYELNSGAVLKFMFEGHQESVYTLPIAVVVI